MWRVKSTVSLALVVALATCLGAEEIWVPDNYSSIQQAIYASANGDTIIVRPGVYKENIRFWGKSVIVKSEMEPEVTIIDGNRGGNSVVTFADGETHDTVLDGFTITNGWSVSRSQERYGGGISCKQSSPTISNNIIRGNRSEAYGGGIYCESGTPIIISNTICYNMSNHDGGGIHCKYADSTRIIGNVIASNSGAGISELLTRLFRLDAIDDS